MTRQPDEIIDETPRVMRVMVTNRNDFTISDMFDGIPYKFPPNQHVSVPVDAAFHIFGWHPPFTDADGETHEVDKTAQRTHVIKRMGWNTPAKIELADIYFGNIIIAPVRYRMVAEVEGEEKPKASRPNKLMQAADEAAARA